MTILEELSLADNQITDILPLVNNVGLGYGSELHLDGNHLGSTSCTSYVAQPESRGAKVHHDCP